MSLTSETAADIVYRALLAQGIERDVENIQNDIRPALMDISRTGMMTDRAALETTLSLTMGAADSQGIQTVALGATVFEESIELVNDVYHAAIGHKFVYKPTVGHLLALLSTGTTACYTRIGQTLYVRRPSAVIPVTAGALKVKGVLVLTSIGSLPVDMEHILISRLISMAGGNPALAQSV